MKEQKITITEETSQNRIDIFLTEYIPNTSRSQIQKLIKKEWIKVNDKPITPHYKLKNNDVITITKRESKKIEIPQIPIIFYNDDFIVIEKPAKLLSQPLEDREDPSVIDGLLAQFPELKTVGEEQQRFGLVHRLDRDVSGIMIIARNQTTFEHLKNEFKNRKVNKTYTALVHERMKDDDGTIDFPISRSKSGKMRATAKNQEGRDSITKYKVEKRYIHHTLVSAYPKTGRMHQIRVHFKSIGHSIVGDKLYEIKRYKTDESLNRIFLHASSIEFFDKDNTPYIFASELPEQLKNYLKTIK